MNPYERFARRFGRTRVFAWLGRTVIRPIDSIAMGRRGPDSTFGLHLSLLYLTTIGRRSGKHRTVPLLGIPSDDGGTVVVGTNWGGPGHPDWVYNLQANPTAVVERDAVTTEVTAAQAPDADYERYWARFNEIWPPYEAYRARADREIAMFVLSERDS